MSLSLKVARARSRGVGPGAGDPGIFGSIGRFVGKVAGIAKALPGPIGWAASAVQKVLPQQPRVTPITRTPDFITMPDFGPSMPQVPAPGPGAAIERWFPGGETGMMPAPVGAPSGYHVNKSDYFLKDGTFIPKGSRWVKNRHRNPLNPRAASKAVGRIEALKRATARFSRITIRKKCHK